MDDPRSGPTDGSRPAVKKSGHIVAIGGKQGKRGDASKANRAVDDDAADGLAHSPRPETVAPEWMLGESVTERGGSHCVSNHQAVIGRQLEPAHRPCLAHLERLGVVATRQQHDP